jgi:ferredoxin-NADP reductase
MSHKVKILAVTRDTHETYKFSVERPEHYAFTPGQATEVALDREGERENASPFTFTSLPSDPRLEFTIKTYPERDGETDKMRSLQVGDHLLIGDPWGAIKYKGPGLFIAGGAGITPFLSIFRDLHQKGELQKNHLLYSNTHQRDIIAAVELKTRFGDKAHFHLTGEKVEGYRHGRIDIEVLRDFVDRIKPDHCYVCGTSGMVEDVISALKKLGIDNSKIVREDL